MKKIIIPALTLALFAASCGEKKEEKKVLSDQEELRMIHEKALKNAGHTGNIQYQEPNLNPKKRSRKRKVIWFNPPWSNTIKSN